MARKSKANRKKYYQQKAKDKAASARQPSDAPQQKLRVSGSVPAGGGGFNALLKPPILLLFGLAFALYVNTFGHQYALDDKLYITGNELVKGGIDSIPELVSNDLLFGFYLADKNLLAGGRYRPLPLITHAIEYEFLGETPGLDHFINALLYGFTAIVLYLVLVRMVPPPPGTRWYASLAFLATLFWVAHPLHTEVVANIKSRDELMGTLFGLMAMYMFFRYVNERQSKLLIWGTVTFFLGLMCRETAAIFAGTIPLAVFFFSKAFLEQGKLGFFGNDFGRFFNNQEIQRMLVSIAVCTGLFLLIRHQALPHYDSPPAKEWMNQPFMYAEGLRLPTVWYTLSKYLQLLFYPHPLTHDYYPMAIPYTDWGNREVIFAVIAYLGIFGLAIVGLIRRTIWGFAALFFLLNFILFSNLLFDVGSFMNERWMYVPSMGFALALMWVLVHYTRNLPSDRAAMIRLVVIVPIVLAFSWKTVDRNQAWENDQSLALTDVHNSPGSAKANMAAGDAWIAIARDSETAKDSLARVAIGYLKESLRIYPNWNQPQDLLGVAYEMTNNLDSSSYYIRAFIANKRNEMRGHDNLIIVSERLVKQNQLDLAMENLRFLESIGSPRYKVYSGIAQILARRDQNFNGAIPYLERAYQMAPTDLSIQQNLGITYASAGRNQDALNLLLGVYQKLPNDPLNLQNIYLLYANMGNQQKAQEFYQLYQSASGGAAQ